MNLVGCVLGISLFILVPLVYLIGLWHFLHIHFFKMDPREWRVKLIIPEKEQASSDPTPLHQERSLPLYFLEPFSPGRRYFESVRSLKFCRKIWNKC